MTVLYGTSDDKIHTGPDRPSNQSTHNDDISLSIDGNDRLLLSLHQREYSIWEIQLPILGEITK